MPVNVRPTRADREIARVIARNTTPATEETVLTWGADEHVLCAAACRLVAVLPRKACARARGEQSYFDHHHCGDHWTYSCWRTGRAMSRPDLHSARRSNVSFGCSRATAALKARERWARHFHRPDRMRFTCASTCKTCSRLGDRGQHRGWKRRYPLSRNSPHIPPNEPCSRVSFRPRALPKPAACGTNIIKVGECHARPAQPGYSGASSGASRICAACQCD
jgi:hypothetical protein